MAKARITTLARWLGPWSKPDRIPKDVQSEDHAVPGPRPVRYRRWWSTDPVADLIVWPGLHYLGPADPRMDRFCRILAAAGYRVHSPFLSDFLDLQLRPTLLDDALAFIDGLALPSAGTLSISFGCLPAAYAAANRPTQVASLLIFGGYAEWDAAMRFSLTGGGCVPHDPLNHPVSFMNLVEHLAGAPADPTPLLAAWRQYIEATWGKVEMKAPDAWPAEVRKVAETLDPALRPLFLRGCGLAPGALGLVETALVRAGGRAWLDPRPHLARVQCPVYLVHGMDDDVIPHTQAHLLEAAIPPGFHAGTYITGLYGHTGHGKPGLGALTRELKGMMGILKALARLAETA